MYVCHFFSCVQFQCIANRHERHSCHSPCAPVSFHCWLATSAHVYSWCKNLSFSTQRRTAWTDVSVSVDKHYLDGCGLWNTPNPPTDGDEDQKQGNDFTQVLEMHSFKLVHRCNGKGTVTSGQGSDTATTIFKWKNTPQSVKKQHLVNFVKME